MGRQKDGTNISHSKEEKLSLVLRNLAVETAMNFFIIVCFYIKIL